ncbi:hypothetical protein WJX82_006600 [Trebouxia sp. C0006]
MFAHHASQQNVSVVSGESFEIWASQVNRRVTRLTSHATQDQMRKSAQASLQSSNSLATMTHELNGRHTLEMDALRRTHDVRAAELSEQVTQLRDELEEERRARKQHGERADLAHKALHDRQAELDQAYQRITAAEAASHKGKNKAQAMHADLTSTRQEAADPKEQLSGAVTSDDLDAEKLQQQLAEAQAAGESALADTKKLQQQQPIQLEPSIEQLMAAHHAEPLAEEAASGEQMTALQKELEQLRTYAEQMKVDLEAAQQSQIDTQADAAALQQELQDLQSSTAKAEKQLQNTQKKALQQQQRTERQARSEQINKLSMAAHHVELLAKEGASGEKMPTLQKELEQLHTDAGQMKALPQDAPFSLLMLEWQWLLCGRTVQLRLKLKGSEAAHEKTKAELQRQRTTFTQFCKDHEYMDDPERKKQLALPKPVSVKHQAEKAVEHGKGLADKERKHFAKALNLRWHPDKNTYMRQAAGEVYKALQEAGLTKL